MIAFVLLGAGPEVFILLLIIAIVFVIRVLGKLASLAQGAGSQMSGRPSQRPASSQAVQSQIDEFLRRAAQRQETQRGGQAAKGNPPGAVVTPEVVEDEPVGGRVVRQVKQYLDTSDFQRRSAQLGEEVVQADEQFDQHMQQAFSGEVGKLAHRLGTTAAAADQSPEEDAESSESGRPTLDALALPGEGLASLLGDGNEIVRAIIMSEILQRREI
jgi:hypothetical protein